MSAENPLLASQELVARYWKFLEERNWTAFESLLAPEFTAHWPQSGEQFSKEAFVLVNRNYPGDWHCEPAKFFPSTEWVITETPVRLDDTTATAISIFEISDNLIRSLREYWPDPFPIPEWRQDLFR